MEKGKSHIRIVEIFKCDLIYLSIHNNASDHDEEYLKCYFHNIKEYCVTLPMQVLPFHISSRCKLDNHINPEHNKMWIVKLTFQMCFIMITGIIVISKVHKVTLEKFLPTILM